MANIKIPPVVTDEMLEAALKQTEAHEMSPQERLRQTVSFVWGNDVEGKSSMEEVCDRLHIPRSVLCDENH